EGSKRLFAFSALIVLLDDASHAQQAIGRGCRRAGAPAHFLDQRTQLGEQRAVDAQWRAVSLAGEGQGQRNVAALHAPGYGAACPVLEAIEALGQAAADLQIASIDASCLPNPASPHVRALRARVSRHTCDQ